jgi:SHS2 domain-containing protein
MFVREAVFADRTESGRRLAERAGCDGPPRDAQNIPGDRTSRDASLYCVILLSSTTPSSSLRINAKVSFMVEGTQLWASPVGRWELFAHDADIGVRGVGPSREAAFEQAAIALMHAIGVGNDALPEQSLEIACAAPDDETLLVDWLNALIFEMATRSMLFSRFRVRIEDGSLFAEVWGEPIDLERHEIAVEAKGATFTALEVGQTPEGNWVAQCVVDV